MKIKLRTPTWLQLKNLCAPRRNKKIRMVFFVGLFASIVSGCGSHPHRPWHSFVLNGAFDGWGPHIDLLAYSYGDKFRMLSETVHDGQVSLPKNWGVSAPMPVGEFLYVKWRIKNTGEVFEERVDLRKRLPSKMDEYRITFVIEGRNLYVYLVTPQSKKREEPPIHKTSESFLRVTHQIYPDKSSEK